MHAGTLDTAVLCRELISVSDWRSLGLNLGVRDYELDQIESSNPNEGCGRWRQEAISLWLQRTPSASWKNVVNALQEMRQYTLAERIHREYIGGTARKSVGACMLLVIGHACMCIVTWHPK